jgi:hypothetical protein
MDTPYIAYRLFQKGHPHIYSMITALNQFALLSGTPFALNAVLITTK